MSRKLRPRQSRRMTTSRCFARKLSKYAPERTGRQLIVERRCALGTDGARVDRVLPAAPAPQLVDPATVRHREQPRQQRPLVPLKLLLCRCCIRKHSLGQFFRLAGIPSPAKQMPVHLAVVAPKRLLGWAPHHLFLAHPNQKVTPLPSSGTGRTQASSS